MSVKTGIIPWLNLVTFEIVEDIVASRSVDRTPCPEGSVSARPVWINVLCFWAKNLLMS